MVFQTNQIDLSKFIKLFQIIDNKVNNLNIITVIISKEKNYSEPYFFENYLLFILEGNLNLF